MTRGEHLLGKYIISTRKFDLNFCLPQNLRGHNSTDCISSKKKSQMTLFFFRFESISSKLQSASDHFAESDDRRQHVETQYQSTGDKIELLESQVAEAKRIAEESDAKCEEIVRKLVLGEHHKDRAEERAARSDAKIAMLESELGGVNKTMKSLSNQGDENGKREEDLEEEIKDVKERFRNAEVNAEMAERTVQKLQTEIDRMETALLAEKTKKTRMEEDMEHLVQSIGDI